MANILPDTPLRLRDAVKEAFPAGGVTVAALRREIARGRLEAELIAGKHFVTLAAIARMRELCRTPAKPQTEGIGPSQPSKIQCKPVGPTPQEILRARLHASKEAWMSRGKLKPSPKPSSKKCK